MKASFRKSFLRDVKKIKEGDVLNRIRTTIEDVEQAANLQDIRSLTKISGTADFYRIRIGDYRVGVAVEEDTVEFVCKIKGV